MVECQICVATGEARDARRSANCSRQVGHGLVLNFASVCFVLRACRTTKTVIVRSQRGVVHSNYVHFAGAL